jgi:hypothetical protein
MAGQSATGGWARGLWVVRGADLLLKNLTGELFGRLLLFLGGPCHPAPSFPLASTFNEGGVSPKH